MYTVMPYTVQYSTLLRTWLDARGLAATPLDDLPEVGFVCGPAAGFLRRVEGDYAIMDSLVTDPKANSHDRNASLTAVMEALVQKARELNIKAIIGTTVHGNTRGKAERLGFVARPHTLMTLKLERNQ